MFKLHPELRKRYWGGSLWSSGKFFRSVGNVTADTIKHYIKESQEKPKAKLQSCLLENRGPGHDAGDRRMIPFLVNMDKLYELFVARWLERNLKGERYSIQSQEQVLIDSNLNINFRIDLSIFDKESRLCAFVMDTKYKVGSPTTDDIEQIAAYAEAKGCKDAVLIYPECSVPGLEGRVGKIRVRSAAFSLAGDLDSAGRKFIKDSLGIEI
jgi:5-methylcytosine-specific restriction enzyme subunit McrC